MQNRSQWASRCRDPYRLEYAPVDLPAGFPVRLDLFEQKDRPIERLHMHNALEIGLCLEGTGIFVIENKVMPFRQGDVCVINDREFHLARSTPGSTSRWAFLMIDPARLAGADLDDPALVNAGNLCGPEFKNIYHASEHGDLHRAAMHICEELRRKERGYRTMVRHLVCEVLIHIQRHVQYEPQTRAATGAGKIGRIAPALEHCALHYHEAVPVSHMAEKCHVSESHLRRLFAEATGQSPKEYLNRLRVKMAAAMLDRGSDTILEISYAVGFQSITSFNRLFRRYTGMTPKQARKG